ncbi:MAG: PorT family protein [Bacteroidales bacterium]|nr:PorT family protein [Bacteroidales bacterium]
MRKIFAIYLIFIFHFFSNKVPAQNFEGGPLAGLTASQMDGDMLGGYNKLGLTAGVWVGRNVGQKWNYRAELKYTMKGAASNKATENYPYYRKTLYYVELPLVVSYALSENLMAEAGFSIAYLARATVNIGNGVTDALQPMNKIETNALVGLIYPLNKNFELNLRFSYSLFPVSQLPGNLTIWSTYGQYNNVISLCVYYKFK